MVFESKTEPKTASVAVVTARAAVSRVTPLLASALVFFGVQQCLNFTLSFVPFGGFVAFAVGVPIAALAAEAVFVRLSGGHRPTRSQGAMLVALGASWYIGGLAVNLALATDEGTSMLRPFLIACPLLLSFTGWGLTAMRFWETMFFIPKAPSTP